MPNAQGHNNMVATKKVTSPTAHIISTEITVEVSPDRYAKPLAKLLLYDHDLLADVTRTCDCGAAEIVVHFNPYFEDEVLDPDHLDKQIQRSLATIRKFDRLLDGGEDPSPFFDAELELFTWSNVEVDRS